MPRRKPARLNSSEALGDVGFVEMNNPGDKDWKKTVHSLAAQRYYLQARETYVHKDAGENGNTVASRRGRPEDGDDETKRPRSVSGRMALSGAKRQFPTSHTHPTSHDERGRFLTKTAPFHIGVVQDLDPFTVLARPPNGLQDYIFNHYLHHVTKRANTCEHASYKLRHLTGDGSHHVELTLADDALLNAILLSASRSLTQLYTSGPFYEATLRYKDACIRSINRDISQQGRLPMLSTIAAVVALAADSFVFEEIPVTEQHCNAAAMMIGLRGGTRAFDAEGLLRMTVQWFTVCQPNKDSGVWRKLEVFLDEM